MLVPKRGTPGLHLIIARDGGLAVDLGLRFYRQLKPLEAVHPEGAIVRLRGISGLERAAGVTRSDLFTYPATILRVIDGDTLLVELELTSDLNREITLRLRGLDCPDLSTPAGQAAKRFVDTLLAPGAAVIITTTQTDSYDRYLADVFIETSPGATGDGGGIFLNNALLANGHAVRFDGRWPDDDRGWV